MSKLDRLWKCGRYLRDPAGTDIAVKNGSAYFTGLTTCGSVWACPVCSARIRQRRALEIETAVLQHLQSGGGVGFLTLTLPHQRDDELAQLLGVVQGAWKGTQQSRGVRALGAELELSGRIRSTEITYGAWHGWHPHLHVLLLTDRDTCESAWEHARGIFSRAWAHAVVRLGADRPGEDVGVTLARVERAEIGQYLAKVQDHYGEPSSLGREMARGDVKRGRKRSRTPFELAEAAVQGVVPELPLWWTYEQATKGRRAIEWSRGLKARFDVAEVADEDLAAADVDGDRVVRVDGEQWGLLLRSRSETHVLDLVEQGGQPAAHAFLAGLARAYERESA